MTETMIVEAVRAAGGFDPARMTAAPVRTIDPEAIARFEAAMAPEAPQGMPLVSEISGAIAASQDSYHDRVSRLETLAATMGGGQSAVQMLQLQYEVASLTFQQSVVTDVAKKASDAISTLVKNQ